MSQDLHAVLRRLWARRWLVSLSVAGQGLVLAATVVLFAVSDRLLLQPLPYPHADRIVALEPQSAALRAMTPAQQTSLADAIGSGQVVEHGAYVGTGVTVFLEHSAAVRDWGLKSVTVSAEFFQLFGQPALGRGLVVDDLFRTPRPIVIGHGIWQRVFGGRSDVVNLVVDIPGTSWDPRGLGNRWQIVGVMPRAFDLPFGTNAWALHDGPQIGRVSIPGPVRRLPTFARAASGVSVDQLAGLLPGIAVVPVREYVTPRGAVAFWYLLAASVLVLGSLWLQQAGLIATRVAARPRELTTRSALGATRWQMLRPVVFEGLVIAALSLGVGIALVSPFSALLTRPLPPEIRLGADVWFGMRSVLFIGALMLGCAVVLAAGPALVASRSALAPLVTTRSSGNRRVGRVLLGCQLASCVVLACLAVLAWRSSEAAASAQLGFNPRRLLAVRLPALLPPSGTTVDERMFDTGNQMALNREALLAVRSTPGVEAASLASRWPLERSVRPLQAVRAASRPSDFLMARVTTATDEYLRTVGGELLEGHVPSLSDGRDAVLVDEAMAGWLRGSGSVLGATLQTGNLSLRITGVIRNSVHERPDEDHTPEVIRQIDTGAVLLVRLSEHASDRVRQAILASLTALWGPDRTPRSLVSIEAESRRTRAWYITQETLLVALSLLVVCALAASIVTTIALLLYERRLEFGIRHALGATGGDVRRRIWLEISWAGSAGVVLGLIGAWSAARVMQTLWFDLETAAWPGILGVAVGVGLLMVVAVEWPVRQFRHISPFLAIKDE